MDWAYGGEFGACEYHFYVNEVVINIVHEIKTVHIIIVSIVEIIIKE